MRHAFKRAWRTLFLGAFFPGAYFKLLGARKQVPIFHVRDLLLIWGIYLVLYIGFISPIRIGCGYARWFIDQADRPYFGWAYVSREIMRSFIPRIPLNMLSEIVWYFPAAGIWVGTSWGCAKLLGVRFRILEWPSPAAVFFPLFFSACVIWGIASCLTAWLYDVPQWTAPYIELATTIVVFALSVLHFFWLRRALRNQPEQ